MWVEFFFFSLPVPLISKKKKKKSDTLDALFEKVGPDNRQQERWFHNEMSM